MADPSPVLSSSMAVVHRSLSDEVVDRLREGIITGVLKPGQHLREASLSIAMDVSRSPIRDAFAQLNHEGLVTIRRHRGAVVVGMTEQDIEEVYSLRLSLETLAVRLATERATSTELAALRDAATFADPGDQFSQEQFAKHDVAFHELFYVAARHERLYAAWSMLRPHLRRFLLARNIANADYKDSFSTEHSALAETVAAGDSEAAQRMIVTHLEGAYTRLLRSYAEGMGNAQAVRSGSDLKATFAELATSTTSEGTSKGSQGGKRS
jgi:DNA-binding GntR family transcriptional regulator